MHDCKSCKINVDRNIMIAHIDYGKYFYQYTKHTSQPTVTIMPMMQRCFLVGSSGWPIALVNYVKPLAERWQQSLLLRMWSIQFLDPHVLSITVTNTLWHIHRNRQRTSRVRFYTCVHTLLHSSSVHPRASSTCVWSSSVIWACCARQEVQTYTTQSCPHACET